MKISIITACFNSEKTIRKTIESVFSQDYVDFEYIIIDGGSSDSTLSIVEDYRSKIAKIISEKDNGIYDALNKGIKYSTGEIISFLHSDDFYANSRVLSNVSKSYANEKNSIIIGDIEFVNDFEEKVRYYSGKRFDFSRGIMPPHPATFIKKKCYLDFGLFNLKYKIASDYDFLFRLLEIERLSYNYCSDVLIKMNTGGISNRSIFSVLSLNKEIYKIHKAHNRPIGIFKLLEKIPVRIMEMSFVKKLFKK